MKKPCRAEERNHLNTECSFEPVQCLKTDFFVCPGKPIKIYCRTARPRMYRPRYRIDHVEARNK